MEGRLGGSRGATIVGLGSALGQRVLTNADLERMVDTSDEWITSRTGIRERRVAAAGTATSDLASQAASEALASAGVAAEDVDLVIVATATPDQPFPATACLVAARLGATRAAAFDLEAGCTGFVYALTVGANLVSAGAMDTVVVVGADVLSRITDYSDRRTCVLFGDGAGAVVLRPTGRGMGVLGSVLGADGRGGDLIHVAAGGSRRPASAHTVASGDHYLRMDGHEVFKFSVRVVETATERVLATCGLGRDDVDFLVPHQANLRIIEAEARRLGLPADRVLVNIERTGNMSAASIPVVLHEAVTAGRVSDGDVLLLVAFGAGLTWGSTLVRWQPVPTPAVAAVAGEERRA